MKRRDFLRGAAAVAGGVAGLPSHVGRAGVNVATDVVATTPGAVESDRPNLMVIIVDDLGYGDLSCYGAKDLRTPNIDQLVAGGMRFDNFYANCPVCSPTRAALLTGRYQELVGVPGVIRTHRHSSWGYLHPEAVLLPAALKAGGYTSAIVGKWHLGLAGPNTPNERGFDFFHGFLGDMMDDYYHHRRHNNNYMRKNDQVLKTRGTHATNLFTQWACDYLKRQKADKSEKEEKEGKEKKKFFLYLAYNAPHSPIQPPKDWLARVHKREPKMSNKRAKIVALIEHLDDGIGKVLETLDQTGLSKNTLVIFVSDNGGATRFGAHNGRTRAGKGTCYEGGIRVPMCARWPGRIKPGSRSQRVALTMDIFPTLTDAAGVKVSHEIDGVSFLAELLGKDAPAAKRDLFFGRLEGGRGGPWKTNAIRRGDWKLVRPRHDRPLELYNLKADPLETTDLAKKEPAKFKELSAALAAQLKRYAAVPWKPPK